MQVQYQADERAKHAHFTLIEMLVVIGVIAILASMLLMVVSKSRERARYTRWLAFSADMEKDDGLIGHWRFLTDDYTNGVVKNYARGLNRQEYHQTDWDGTPGGAYAWGTGRYQDKKAMTFGAGGNDGRLLTSTHLHDFSTTFSAVAWVKVPTDDTFLCFSQGGGIIPIRIVNGVLQSRLLSTGDTNSGMTLRDGKWTLVAVVYDADLEIMTFYVNGETDTPNGFNLSGSLPSDSPTGVLKIGNGSGTNGGCPGAWLDELAIYERALTQDQIRDMYKMGTVD